MVRPFRLIARLAVVLVSLIAPVLGQEEPEALPWHYSYQEALAEAKGSGKPILLCFRCAP
ncbi:hypothetical protein GCM10007100_01170 [Roseibacillus persicicus]|uniref:Thioredoxin domain-containing protein n=2 Tax=Roseibacillus persicicus TaxID=454148 RepID=A0A918WDC1_9BACT|nr:hypothetical protein GCM10007100_01170 [Roseibacillus persicicus]